MPRVFVGLEIQHDIAEDIFKLRSPLPGARWTRAEDYHLTFRFLGDIDNRQTDELVHALAAIDLPAFDIELQGVGQFGGEDPKVVFADVRPSDELEALSRAIDSAIRRARLPLEKRNFKPHVTLARLRHSDPQPVARYLQRYGAYRSRPLGVSRFVLFSSKPQTGGPPYVVEADFPLRTWEFDEHG